MSIHTFEQIHRRTREARRRRRGDSKEQIRGGGHGTPLNTIRHVEGDFLLGGFDEGMIGKGLDRAERRRRKLLSGLNGVRTGRRGFI